jgi:hypothetical protein
MRSAGSYVKDGVGQTDTLERDAPMAYSLSHKVNIWQVIGVVMA